MSTAALVLRSSIAGSAWHAAQTAISRARDSVARRLIARAWNRTPAAGVAVKPWPGADLFPVVRLEAPSHRSISIVLAGARARALRFGPGHFEGTPLPGEPGNAVISGHCRTHFAFLRDLRSGDPLCVHVPGGIISRYAVSGIEVVRNKDVRVLLDAGDDRLTLVTCYPFDRLLPGSLRYVVVATRSRT